jgi:BASS family bile acid:Na+ symporter
MQAEVLIRIAIVISVVVVVVALGLRSEPGDATYLLRKPGLLLRSVVAINIIMPMIAVLLVSSFHLKTPVAVGLIALAISPLPPLLAAKSLNLQSHGYIHSIVIAAAICSLIIMPVAESLLSLHFHARHIDILKVSLVVVVTVLAPLSVGHFIHQMWPARASSLAAFLYKIGMGLLTLSLFSVLALEWHTIRSLIGDGTLAAAIFLSGIGLLVGHLMAGSDPEKRTVLALATASRHPGVAIVAGISASIQAPQLVTDAVLLASIVSMIVCIPYMAWRRRIHAGHDRY